MGQYNIGLYKGTRFNDDNRLLYFMQTSSSYFFNYGATIKGALFYPVLNIMPMQTHDVNLNIQEFAGSQSFSVSGGAYILNSVGGWSISSNLPSGTLTTTLSFIY